MTNDELRALNKTRHIQQIAWLTRDLEKSMQAWIDTLQIGPWRVFRFTEKTVKNLKVDGKLVEGPSSSGSPSPMSATWRSSSSSPLAAR